MTKIGQEMSETLLSKSTLDPCLPLPLQRHPFIQMYEERSVDVASYVCRHLDQMPTSPSSPMYVD